MTVGSSEFETISPGFAEEPSVREVARLLNAASPEDRLGSACASLRSLRNALLLQGYLQGYTLEQVGRPFNLTRERVRQLVNRIVPASRIHKARQRLPKPKHVKQQLQEQGRQKRISGELQKNRTRNSEIEQLVHEGLTYSEVSEKIGVTRNVVCTVMYRARHRYDLVTTERKYPRIDVPKSVHGRRPKAAP